MFALNESSADQAGRKTKRLVELVSKTTAERVQKSRSEFDAAVLALLSSLDVRLKLLTDSLQHHAISPRSAASWRPSEDSAPTVPSEALRATDKFFAAQTSDQFSDTSFLSDNGIKISFTEYKETEADSELPAPAPASGKPIWSSKIRLEVPTTPNSTDARSRNVRFDLDPEPEEVSSEDLPMHSRDMGRFISPWFQDAWLNSSASEAESCALSQQISTCVKSWSSKRDRLKDLEENADEDVIQRKSRRVQSKLSGLEFAPEPLAQVWWLDMDDSNASIFAWLYCWSIQPLIFISVVISLATIADGRTNDANSLTHLQIAFDALSTLEVSIRFFLSFQKLYFWKDPFNFIDLLAAFPLLILNTTSAFVDNLSPTALWAISIVLSTTPVLRLCKLLRRFQTFHLLLNAFQKSMDALPVLMFVFCAIGLAFACLLFATEPRRNLPTLQNAAWLTLITMTTVGYGDKVPETETGKFFVGCLVVMQVLYMALPLGILGYEFTSTWQNRARFWAVTLVKSRMAARGLGLKDIPAFYQRYGNKDGALEFYGFSQFVSQLGVKLDEKHMLDVYQGFDEDGGGFIDEVEFAQALFPDEYRAAKREEERRLKGSTSTTSFAKRTSSILSRIGLARMDTQEAELTPTRTADISDDAESSIGMQDV